VRVVRGHAGSVRCLQFDENKIMSGSSDRTIKVCVNESCLFYLARFQSSSSFNLHLHLLFGSFSIFIFIFFFYSFPFRSF
jgi:hypothetical protein